DITGTNETIGSLTGAGNVTLGGATLSIGSDNTSPAAYTGNISGSGGVTKVGGGNLTLPGTSGYTRPPNRSRGNLLVNTGTSLASSSIQVNSGGTLGGNGTINVGSVVNASGSIDPGATPGQVGTLSSTSTINMATATALYTFQLSTPASSDLLTSTG